MWQGMIWHKGYLEGELTADLFPDVLSALQQWAAAGMAQPNSHIPFLCTAMLGLEFAAVASGLPVPGLEFDTVYPWPVNPGVAQLTWPAAARACMPSAPWQCCKRCITDQVANMIMRLYFEAAICRPATRTVDSHSFPEVRDRDITCRCHMSLIICRRQGLYLLQRLQAGPK